MQKKKKKGGGREREQDKLEYLQSRATRLGFVFYTSMRSI